MLRDGRVDGYSTAREVREGINDDRRPQRPGKMNPGDSSIPILWATLHLVLVRSFCATTHPHILSQDGRTMRASRGQRSPACKQCDCHILKDARRRQKAMGRQAAIKRFMRPTYASGLLAGTVSTTFIVGPLAPA